MDKDLERLLEELYKQLETKSNYTVGEPEYQREQIDALARYGLITKMNVSATDKWAYIIRPTHEGRTFFQQKELEKNKKRRQRAFEWAKFLVPTFISLGALIVSIIALSK